jgi:oxygen-independent coproporphyrinogen-3 oxidase
MRKENNCTASLYIHVPFCRSKCPYCAFYSFRPSAGQMERWCRCIIKELEMIRRTLPADCMISSIYCGGGTPSYLPVTLWADLLKELALFSRTADCEFTVEANPESVDQEKLTAWQYGGVNRVSLGIQSLDSRELRMIARPHSASEALEVLEQCMNHGFRTSGDLIFGLPNQTLRRWHASMSRLAAEGIRHISVYQLMIEPESFWGQHTPEHLPDGYPMYRWAQYYLPHRGLRQYEIASFAVPGEESRHNLAYWRRSNVYAAGPAAWGFVDGSRYANDGDFTKWAEDIEMGRSPVTYREHLQGGREASEAAVLALRTCFGISFQEFSSRYGSSYLEEILQRLRKLPPQDFCWTDRSVALSQRGMRVGNSIWTELLDLEQCDKP